MTTRTRPDGTIVTKPKADSEKVLTEVLAGRYDGILNKLAEALTQRMRDTQIRFYWRIHLDGDTWDAESVTAGELAFTEQLLSRPTRPFSYTQLDPIASMEHRSAVIVAHLHKVCGASPSDAIKLAEALTAVDHEKLLEVYQVDDHPKDDPASDSSGS